MSSGKQLEQVFARARSQGWTITHTRGGRIKMESPEGYQVYPNRGGDNRRGYKNLLSELRSMGYVDKFVDKERKEVSNSESTSNVGEALAAAKAVDERKQQQDHTAAGATRRYFRENPGKVMSVDEVALVVMARFPKANKIAVQQAINKMALDGTLTRVARGTYRYADGAPTGVEERPAAPVMQAPAPARGSLGDASLDEQLERIDLALTALSQIEEVVRDVHAKLAKLAELKRMLS